MQAPPSCLYLLVREVFTVKIWIFFLAFYVHLGTLPDAPSAAQVGVGVI